MSSLTATTFLSGAKKTKDDRPASLLHRLPKVGALLVLKDFGTILSMREDARAEILGQLREIYDGSLVKEFGTGYRMEWEGRLGFLAGTTPAIDVHHAVIAVLGERFLYFRAPAADRKEMSRRSLHVKDEAAMRERLQSAVFAYMENLGLPERPEMPREVEDRIVNVADIVTWARSAVHRDRFTRDIEVAPEPEGASLFAKQLGSLWRALTVMGHEDPLALVCRVALDSMPPARAAALTKLATSGVVSTTDLRKVTRLSQTANRRVVEDLEALELVEIVTHGGAGVPSTWSLTRDGAPDLEGGLRRLPGLALPRLAPAISREGGMGRTYAPSGCCGCKSTSRYGVAQYPTALRERLRSFLGGVAPRGGDRAPQGEAVNLPCILCSMTDDGLGWFGPGHVRDLWWSRPTSSQWTGTTARRRGRSRGRR
jgi:DNA-binding MarR family transcriptional regulator